MHTLLFEPTDVLFFRDGRPMGGSLSGHASGWPLPTVTSAALHAALHRADLAKIFGRKVHGHDHHRRQGGGSVADVRKFGSLSTAGPFPVLTSGEWLFPRPLDVGMGRDGDHKEFNSTAASLAPRKDGYTDGSSSLPAPLKYPVASTLPPTKATPAPWWTAAAWNAYLNDTVQVDGSLFHKDTEFADTEHSYGIGMDSETQAQDGARFYSAHYLRMKPECRIGLIASAMDKVDGSPENKDDLIATLFPNSNARTPIVVGGQQRLCTVERRCGEALRLPRGRAEGFQDKDGVFRVKWVLFSPAIYPAISAQSDKGIVAHSGGWLPNWIAATEQSFDGETVPAGSVLLLDGPGKDKARRKHLKPGKRIDAQLVAAVVGKPIPVTGYALAHKDAERPHGTAKPTYLAVPAGSIYYFETGSAETAKKLADALNWHGATNGNEIANRRSTLMGEKGFGLGVCGSWTFYDGPVPST